MSKCGQRKKEEQLVEHQLPEQPQSLPPTNMDPCHAELRAGIKRIEERNATRAASRAAKSGDSINDGESHSEEDDDDGNPSGGGGDKKRSRQHNRKWLARGKS